jgi:tubulin polyglutamylase TTLL6/13
MPYLINGKKFDFRIYVLVTQVVPEMQVFIYKDGLARFATENYVNNYEENLFMHLTNYAINKESEKFEGNEADFKKTMSETLDIIEEE